MRFAVPGRTAAEATRSDTLGGGLYGRHSEITGVRYVPNADIVGAATNSLTLNLYNVGPDPAAPLNILVATLALVAGVNASRRQGRALTLQATNGAPIAHEGDILRWESVKVGAGLADPGGAVLVDEKVL